VRVLLLPGMDGTGRLFARFVAAAEAAGARNRYEAVEYPADRELDYAQLEAMVRAQLVADYFTSGEPRPPCPTPDLPTALVAESFSGPLAISIAAAPPPGLRALVLVASFARAPAPRWLAPLLGPGRFRRTPSRFEVRTALTGWASPRAIVDEVREAIAAVAPTVLAARARALLEVDVRTQLERIELPLLVLRASRDRLVAARALARLPAHARSLELDGPHLLLQSSPQPCVDAIEEFLQSC
jgi:pimeloyl-[acyl-carrier protein] methyl ester esterase